MYINLFMNLHTPVCVAYSEHNKLSKAILRLYMTINVEVVFMF